MFSGFSSVLSFLTIIPSSGSLDGAARHMYLFPAVGLIVGLIVGSVAFGLSLFLDPLLVGVVVAAFIAIITGIHHTDGLADFADGLMAKGNSSYKLAAMKDVSTGSAGVVSVVLYMAGLIAAISLAGGGLDLLYALLISEVLAKFSMVLMACIGRSAAHGSNSLFILAMKDKRRLVVSFVIMLVPVVVLGGADGLLALGVVVAFTLFILGVATKSFGGITGDVLGASNEITRLACVMVLVSI